MIGIAPRPVAVVIHDRVPGGTCDANLLSKIPITKHILLIVKPGMATDAKPCQIRASMKASEHDRNLTFWERSSFTWSVNWK